MCPRRETGRCGHAEAPGLPDKYDCEAGEAREEENLSDALTLGVFFFFLVIFLVYILELLRTPSS